MRLLTLKQATLKPTPGLRATAAGVEGGNGLALVDRLDVLVWECAKAAACMIEVANLLNQTITVEERLDVGITCGSWHWSAQVSLGPLDTLLVIGVASALLVLALVDTPLFAKLLLAPNEDGKRLFRHHTSEPHPPFGQRIARRHYAATGTPGGTPLAGAYGLLAVGMGVPLLLHEAKELILFFFRKAGAGRGRRTQKEGSGSSPFGPLGAPSFPLLQKAKKPSIFPSAP